ncbi:Bacteroidetes-specific membrane protein [Psychroflexus gondwanensis ACAM 44]|jgi:type IX secretion system PorP/SprF family membrane protein|uniref:Bacteroidetes-specific membrane protein n=1 Tax=Psychroflexus gondwanensis ACAM 44 TaxID=1189619 RepID=N1WPM8_9FLAO|nr:type IX secretion system membrane protein PorP/SprF [Psychroflexus gondwanensis]EMY82256.1 Bacteroidetes-specific membrane protein [Psychroflexus gondwanensis ACAM 44]
MMRNFLKNIGCIVIIVTGIGNQLQAQTDVKLSNFVYTPLVLNPAYAGSSDGYSATALYTSQWVGFDGAPETLIVTGHDRIGLTNLGAGFDVMSDKIGASKENRVVGNIAYHLRLSQNWLLSTGVKLGVNNYAIDYSLLSIENQGEFGNPFGDLSRTSLIFGTGFFLHRENFFLGVAIPNFLTTEYIDDFRNTLANTTPNYFISTGYRFELEREVYFQPTVMTRVAKGAPYSALFSFNLDWKDRIFASANYEHNVTAGAFVGLRITDQIMAGYAYDTAITTFSQYNGGIHSFMINFRAKERYRRDRCGCFTY